MPADTIQFYAEMAKAFEAAAATAEGSGQLANASFNGDNGNSAKGVSVARPTVSQFAKQIADAYPDPYQRDRVMKFMKPMLLQKLGTTDIGPMLLTSISSRMPYIAFDETPYTQMMRSAPGPKLTMNDYVHRTVERRPSTDRARNLNPEIITQPIIENETKRTQIDNTLAFWGEEKIVPLVTSNMAQQQQNVDLMDQELQDGARQLARAQNYDYWNGLQQNNFANGAIPIVGGLLSRIYTNIISCGGVDIAEALLEQGKLAIGTKIGHSKRLAIFGDTTQLNPIRLLEIDRYGGSNQISYMRWEEMKKRGYGDLGLDPDRIFEPSFGSKGAIPVFHDQDLTNTLVMMCVEADFIPKEVKFVIGGQTGPWLVALPIHGIVDAKMMFDGGSVDDPAEESRVKYVNAP